MFRFLLKQSSARLFPFHRYSMVTPPPQTDTTSGINNPITQLIQISKQSPISIEEESQLQIQLQQYHSDLEQFSSSTLKQLEVRKKLSQCYARLFQYHQSIDQMRKIIELEKDVQGAPWNEMICNHYENLRDLLMQDGRVTEAIQTQQLIIQNRPKLYDYRKEENNFNFDLLMLKDWFDLSQLYKESKNSKQTIACLCKCRDIFETVPVAKKDWKFIVEWELAQQYYETKDYESCFKLCSQLSISEQNIDTQINIYYYMGNCCMFLHRIEEAESFYKKAIAIIDNHSNDHNIAHSSKILYSLGIYYVSLDVHLQQAKQYLMKALELMETILKEYSITDVQVVEYKMQRIQIFMTLGMLEKKFENYSQAQQHLQQALQYLLQLAQDLRTDIHSKESINNLAPGTTLIPKLKKDMAFIYNEMAETFEKLDQKDDAMEMYSRALELANTMTDKATNPIFANILKNLGSYYLQKKQYKESENYLKQAYDVYHGAYSNYTDFHPDIGFIALQLAHLYFEVQKYQTSIQYCEEASEVYLLLKSRDKVLETIRFFRQVESVMRQSGKLTKHELDYLNRKVKDNNAKEKIIFNEKLFAK